MKTFLSSIISAMRGLLRTVIGEIRWQPPDWVERFAGYLQQSGIRFDFSTLRIVAAAVLGVILFLRLALVNNEGLIVVAAVPPGLSDVTPQGLVPGVLAVEFSKAALKIELVDKTVTQRIRLSPEMAGTWTCAGDNRLVFQPKTPTCQC